VVTSNQRVNLVRSHEGPFVGSNDLLSLSFDCKRDLYPRDREAVKVSLYPFSLSLLLSILFSHWEWTHRSQSVFLRSSCKTSSSLWSLENFFYHFFFPTSHLCIHALKTENHVTTVLMQRRLTMKINSLILSSLIFYFLVFKEKSRHL